MTETEITFAPFAPEHLPAAVALSEAEGWPHRAEDWALTAAVSQGVVALIGGAVVGTGLCACFGPVAALNMIITAQTIRGRGVGRTIMERLVEIAGPREMRLVATAAGLPLYEKLGFAARGEILQFQGIAHPGAEDGAVIEAPTPLPALLSSKDAEASGMEREALFAEILARGTVLVAPGGFGCLRPFGRGSVLGPVVAGDDATAQALITAAANRLAGQFLRIDMPAERAPVELLAARGLARVGGGTAMVRTPRTPDLPPGLPPGLTVSKPARTYALASQALG